MPEDSDPELDSLLSRLELHTTRPLDFREGSPGLVQLLAAVATHLNTVSVAEFGGRLGTERQEGLVEQVVSAAFQTFGGAELHADPFEKAAMLFRGVTAGHPFQDGNKRTGFLLSAFYLSQVGYPLPRELSVEAAEQLAVQISRGDIRDVLRIAQMLRGLWGVE